MCTLKRCQSTMGNGHDMKILPCLAQITIIFLLIFYAHAYQGLLSVSQF